MKLSNFKLKASTSNLDRIVKEFSPPASEYPQDRTVVDLIDSSAVKTPDSAALVSADSTVTYGELFRSSNRLAAFLRNQGIGPEKVTAVLLDHSINAIISIVAVLKAGGVFLPLDPDTPYERLKLMLKDSSARLIISSKKYIKTINRLQWECPALATYLCIDSDNVYSETEELSELMKEELWDYVGKSYHDAITGGGWFSSFSGQPFSSEEMEQYAANIFTKLRPYLSKETRVLEIGCATGLSMFPIAAEVKEYHGTDLSAEILENTQKEVSKRNINNITLTHLAAHDIDKLNAKDFDIVIMNSVVQSFNGHHYLKDVIKKCIALMKPRGILFLGDILDLERKDRRLKDLHAYKQSHPEHANRTKTDWSHELFLSRLFFQDLILEIPEVKDVHPSEKTGSIENELTLYNYDVLIDIDKQGVQQAGRLLKSSKTKHQYAGKALVFYRSDGVQRSYEQENLAYIIYTSGSTGTPKGVMVEHRSLVDYVYTYIDEIKLSSGDRVYQHASYAFDASVEGLYPVLCTGGTLVLPGDRKNLAAVVKDFKRYAITVLSSTPPVVDYYNQHADSLSGIRVIFCGGDVLKWGSVNRLLKNENVWFYNVYGPTESTVCATYYPVTLKGANAVEDMVLPIGKPIANRQVYIFDAAGGLQPVGMAGEICIGGKGLARGYLNDPALSAEKFIPHPYYGGQRLYRSGDKGKWLPDGTIQFLGRIDQQVKIRGYRIEPAEIEHHLNRHAFIKDCIVIALEPQTSDAMNSKELAAYYTVTPAYQGDDPAKTVLPSKELRSFLAQSLADFMIPSYFVQMETLPLTPGGKIDKKALPSPEGLDLLPSGDYAEPRNDLEGKLKDIWQDVLMVKTIGIHDNFFNLGGHSLKATKVASRIHKELSVDINLKDIFTYQTIAQLAQVIAEKSPAPLITIKPIEDREYYDLSNAQRRLWVLDQFQETGSGYSMPGAYWLKGILNVPALEQAFCSMIQRHESLRTCFKSIAGMPRQIVLAAQDIDFSITVEQPPLEQLEALIHGHGDHPFVLSQAPLFRVRVLKTSEEEHVLLFNMHHIISDAWSMMIFASEFTHLYNIYARGMTADGGFPAHSLPAPRIQYRDYAAWQNEYIGSEKGEQQKEFWHQTLANGQQYHPPDMPADFPRPPVKTYNGYTLEHRLSPEQTAALRLLCENQGATLFMTLLAAVNVLVYRYTCHQDIIIGSPVAGRDHPDLEDQIGFYVNTIALRCRVDEDDSFASLLERVKQSTAESFEHQSYPFDKLTDELNLDRDHSRHPLFDIMVSVQNTEERAPDLHGLQVIPIDSPFSASKFDLTFNFAENNPTGLPIEINYNTDLFEGNRIHRMMLHFACLLESVSGNPSAAIKTIDILPEAEKQRILEQFNASDGDGEYPADKTLIDLFEDQVLRSPDRTVLVSSEPGLSRWGWSYMTYNQLHTDCHHLSLRLREEGIEGEDIVALEVQRNAAGMAAILGIMKAGAVYLPLAPDAPEERSNYMLKDSNARIIIRPGKNEPYELFIVNTDWLMDMSAGSGTEGCDPAAPCRPAYIMYTSGSTGHPKGVLVEHRSVVNTIWFYKIHCQFDASAVLLHQLSFTFDASLIPFFGAISGGSRMVLLHANQQFEMAALDYIMPRLGVSFFNTTPGFYHTMLKEIPHALTGLKTVVTGGEAPDRQMIRRHFKLLPHTTLINDYGPTETSILSTTYTCQPGDDTANIPIGKPIRNTFIHILDRHMNRQPIGISGEIYISGAGIARGYLNNPELSSERFLDAGSGPFHQPFQPSQPSQPAPAEQAQHLPKSGSAGGRVYRTGDLGRWRADGNIEFLGRVDHQVKVLGYRIELEEIEFHLMTHPAVTQAAVITRSMDNKNQLAAFAACREKDIDLRSHLERYLPAYMVPRYITLVDELPVNTHGKTDRRALAAMALSSTQQQTPYTAPRNPLEEQVASIWERVLEQEKIGIHDNFFERMGHSLKAIQVVSRIYKEMSIELPLRMVFEKPTVAGLAEEIRQTQEKEQVSIPAYSPIQRVEEREYYPLSSAQRRLWVLQQFENVRSAYNMPSAWELKGQLDTNTLHFAFRSLIERHDSLRTSFITAAGEPFQKIQPASAIPFDIDHQTIDSSAQHQEIKTFLEAAFNLETAPLFKVKLLQTGESAFTLLFNMHHIISDGWSMSLFFNQLIACYNTVMSPESSDTGSDTQPLSIQYKDFAAWQNQRLDTGELDHQKEYWHAKLSGNGAYQELPVLDFPADNPRPPARSGAGGAVFFRMEPSLTEQLMALSGSQGVTPFMILTALLNLLIYRYTGQEIIFLGTPVAGRTHPDLEDQIGLYINTLVLANRVNPQGSFYRLLDQVKQTVSEAFDNQLYPFDRLLNELEPDRDPSRHPLFDMMIVMQDSAEIKDSFKDIDASPVAIDAIHCTSKFDLTFTFTMSQGQLNAMFTYSTALFQKERVRRIWWHLEELLDSIFKNRDMPVKHLSLLDEKEKQLLLNELNGVESVYPQDKSLNDLFEDQAAQHPDHIAVVSASPIPAYLTYKELHSKSKQLALYFNQSLGICREDRVALRLPPGANMMVAILAVLKAGAAFVPLDPEFPDQRVQFILRDCSASVLIEENWKISKINQSSSPISRQDTDSNDCPDGPADSHSLAYVIYTSGSTGKPKGVAVEHRSMVNYVSWYTAEVGLGVSEGHRLLLTHSITFDAAFTNLFSALLSGSELHVIPKHDYLDPVYLLHYLSTHKITHLKFIPSLFTAVVNALDSVSVDLSSLRFIMLGGEAIQPADVERFHKVWPHVLFMNHYGPTEATVGAVIQWLDLTKISEYKQRPTIGNPIHNCGVLILDANLEPVPMGVKGELCITGHCLARGYINKPELTAAQFIGVKPLQAGGHSRYYAYRTGDLARWLPSRVIEFLGRTDQQVKIRGYRVELDEISQVLASHPGIKEAAVLAPERDGRAQLTAYLVPEEDNGEPVADNAHADLIRELRQYLSQRLPDYMIPAYFVPLQALPLTANGKLDRKSLLKIGTGTAVSDQKEITEKTQPQNENEALLVEIWQEVLGHQRIGIDDNFFEKGGDSIKAIQVSAGLHKRGRQIKISDLFAQPTIRQLAKRMPQTSSPAAFADQGIVEGDIPLTPVQRQFFQQSWETNNHFNQDVMLFSAKGFDEHLVHQAFEALVRHHDALRMSYRLAEDSSTGGQGIQVIQHNRAVEDHQINLEVAQIDSESSEEIGKLVEEWANALQSSLDITNGPLVQLGLFKTSSGDHLLIVIHHLVVDGVSWRVLIEDFTAVYRQLEKGQNPQLPPKTTSFKEWAEKLDTYAQSPAALRELDYWKEIILTQTQYLPKEKKIKAKHKIYKNTKKVTVEFTEEHTKMLLDVPGRGQSDINDMLLSALMLACHDWARVDKILVNLEGHGREDIIDGVDISRTMGWFTSKYPVLLSMPPSATPEDQLDWTRKTLRSVPNKGIGYGILRYLSQSPEADKLKDAVAPEINFNYLGQFDLTTGDSSLELSPLSSGTPVSPERHFPFTLSIDGIVAHNQMYLFFTYNIQEYPAASILELAEHFGTHLFELAKAETSAAQQSKETTKPLGHFLINDMTLLNREHVQNVFFFPPSIGLGLSYITLAGKLGNCALYAFDYIDRPGRILEYIDYITNIQPSGPYVLGAYSSGCLVFETAKALEQLGKKVSGIILLDALPSDEFRAKVKIKTRDLNKMISTFLEHVKIAGTQGNKQTNDRLRRHALKHNEFIGTHPNTGKINAPLHYIKSSGVKNEYKNWEPFTRSKISLYEGSGKHHEMLFPGHLESNSDIIRRIVDSLSRIKR